MHMPNAGNLHNLHTLQAAVSRYNALGGPSTAQMPSMGPGAQMAQMGAPVGAPAPSAMDVASAQSDMMASSLASQASHQLQPAAALEATYGGGGATWHMANPQVEMAQHHHPALA
jgi:hypothetical protein